MNNQLDALIIIYS